MRSLKSSLIRATVLSVVVVLVAAGVLLSVLAEAALLSHFDGSLAEEARLLASMVEINGDHVDLEFAEAGASDLLSPDRVVYLQLWRKGGEVIFKSATLREMDLERRSGRLDAPEFWDLLLPNGRPGRAVGLEFIAKDGGEEGPETESGEETREPEARFILAMAGDTTALWETLASLRLILVALGLLTIAVTVGAILWAVSRGLVPFTQLSAQIGGLDEHALSQQVDVRGAPRELMPIIGRLNSLLRRLDSAFERERQFSADVAHELRTPLAGLRTTIEVALANPRGACEYQESLGDCLRVVVQMQGLVENLLSLARFESGRLEVRLEAVAMGELARANWLPFRSAAAAKRLDVQWDLHGGEPLPVDPALFGLVMRNLFENAVAHSDDGGWIRIEVGELDGAALFSVANSATGITAEMADRVRTRFWRRDQARSSTGIHHGLGLAVVDKIVSRLGGEVSIDTGRGDRFVISVRFARNRPGEQDTDQEETTE